MSTVPDGTYTILNVYSKTALQPLNGAATAGTYLAASEATVDQFQQWNVQFVESENAYTIQNVGNGLYATTKQVDATPYNGFKTYQIDTVPDYFNFRIGTENGAYFIFPLENTALVLDLFEDETTDNAVIIQNTENPYDPPKGNRNQEWSLLVSTGVPSTGQ